MKKRYELKERLILVYKVLTTKNMHIVEHNNYTLVRVGGISDKQGVSKITTFK